MPLPTDLEEKLRRIYPNYPILPPDDLLRLAAYLAYPDRIRRSLSRLYEEKNRGIRTHQDEIDRHHDFHRYLRAVLSYNRSLPAVESNSAKKKPWGRPTNSNVEGDKRVYDMWRSGDHRTFADLAGTLRRTESEVRKAVDRHRKRLGAAE